jgi:hypothetical protein
MHQNKETRRNFIKEQLRELYNESGETTWHVIAKNDDVEIIRQKYFDLDEREINLKNKEGLTPFAIAFEKNNLEMVRELIKCRCKITNDEMLNFIGNAIEKNNLEMVRELIKCGCEITKGKMLEFINTSIIYSINTPINNLIENQKSSMSSYLMAIFDKFFNSEVDFQGVSPSNFGEGIRRLIYDIPSSEPSSAKKMKFTLSDYNTRSLS